MTFHVCINGEPRYECFTLLSAWSVYRQIRGWPRPYAVSLVCWDGRTARTIAASPPNLRDPASWGSDDDGHLERTGLAQEARA